MNSKKQAPKKISKSSKKNRKSAKKLGSKRKKETLSSFDDSLNMTEVSIQPQNQTFTFQPNQESDSEASQIQFIATDKSYIEQELTQQMELEIYKSLNKNLSEHLAIKQPQISLQIPISSNQKSQEQIAPLKKFKNTRNFKKSLEFEIKNKLNTSIEEPSKPVSKKANQKHSNISPEKENTKKVSSKQEKQNVEPSKPENIESEVTPQNQTQNLQLSSKPTKKLKTERSNKSQPLIKFNVNIKLLNATEKVTKVVKFGNSGQIKKSSESLYIVEVKESKEYKVMNNIEMTHFYKDFLIDFYQGIHFD